MKRVRLLTAAITALMAMNSLGITAWAKTKYRLEVTNQYDTEGSSRDDNDKNKAHPLEPDVQVADTSDSFMEMASDVQWSKDPLNWIAGNEVTGTVHLGTKEGLSKSSLDIHVTNGRNEVKVTSVSKYTGDAYETDLNYLYTVKFTYQAAAQLGETTWAGWDEANPAFAKWNSVKNANTYRVVLYDDQGSVVSQIVEGGTICDFSKYMTKQGVMYYFEVAAIARNGNQQDYLEDGSPVSSFSSGSANPGLTSGAWGDYQEGRRYTYADGSWAVGKWELIMSKWYYFNDQGYAVTGWNKIGGIWYYFYEDGSMAAGVETPDGYKVDASGAWVQ